MRVPVLRYTLLPGILPRLSRLVSAGYAPLAIAMAQAFAALRLLPRNHAYLLAANRGRFNARDVMGEARRHLIIDREHADQVILYYTLLIGFFLLCVEGIGAALMLAVRQAHADVGGNLHNFFVTPQPATDLAYNALDLIFGVTGVFGTDSLNKLANMHAGLLALFHFYNLGILAVAVIVLIYTVSTVVAETANSGQPFGRRFNSTWVPLRLIFAVGLLCPLTQGMNGGQLGTLYIAKWGSSLATNGWITFLDHLNGATQAGEISTLVAETGTPDTRGLQQFLFIAKTCAHYQCLMHGKTIQGYVVNGKASCAYLKASGDCNDTSAACDSVTTQTNATSGTGTTNSSTIKTSSVDNFSNAQSYSQHKNITIRFGEKSTADFPNEAGNVSPVCGTMTYEVKDTAQPGADNMQQSWYDLINTLWTQSDIDTTALNLAKRWAPDLCARSRCAGAVQRRIGAGFPADAEYYYAG